MATAQTYTDIATFTDDSPNWTTLVQGLDGNLYGTTGGGSSSRGTVFRMTPEGAVSTLYSFCAQSGCPDGSNPAAGLVLASDGNFYGTTEAGDANGNGTIFSVTSNGVLTTLHNFNATTDGYTLDGAPLIQGSDGNFYGNTFRGGTSDAGTIFKMTRSGTFTVLHMNCSETNCTDGSGGSGTPVQGNNGIFYGTMFDGGTNSAGTVYKMTPAGQFTTLYNFCSQANCSDGEFPISLVRATNGNFYGTTHNRGGNTRCGQNGCGTVFQITPSGTLTTIYRFCSKTGCSDGANPWAGLVQGSDGAFYGTTSGGGIKSGGTIFRITAKGVLTTLYSYDNSFTEAAGDASIMQATNGIFYGSTDFIGTFNGAIYSLNTGLAPFVSLGRSSGKVGQSLRILGQGLSAATGMAFNGTPAAFTISSDTYLTATVPAGATTGFVTVSTSGGTLASNVKFVIMP
ncbi:MAG TPA: choice-of-anchor tandem repeat GloVer-containing protein [Candidatus Sulfotelmatobacter sp.]